MNRTPLALAAAALVLAVGFFVLGMFSGGEEDRQATWRSSRDAFASLPAGSRREASDGSSGERADGRRRISGADEARERGSIPGRDKRRDGSATVIGTARERSGGVRHLDGVDRSQRLRDLGAETDEEGGGERSHRIPEGLRARGGADTGGDIVPGDGDQAQPGDPNLAAPEGKTFDPFSVYDSDRGPDEEPYLVDQVDFLNDEHGVDMGDDSVLTFPALGNVSGEAGTIHFEFEPDWDGSEASGRTLFRIDEPGQWNNRVRLVKDGNYLRYMFFDNTGAEQNINTPIDNWQAGEPHELTVNWDQNVGKISMYIDGELMAEKPYEGELILDSKSRFDLGSKGGDGYIGAGGRITNLTAYDRPLTPFDF
jgi:hypothetical protein